MESREIAARPFHFETSFHTGTDSRGGDELIRATSADGSA